MSDLLTPNYGDMDKNELRDLAISKGLTVSGSMGKDTLISLLMNHNEEMPIKGNQVTSTVKETNDERVWIEIQKTAEAMGSDDVIVGVNFKTYQIKRGVPVAVPKPVAEVLKNAVRSIYKWNEQTQEKIETQVPAYPFALVMPPQ